MPTLKGTCLVAVLLLPAGAAQGQNGQRLAPLPVHKPFLITEMGFLRRLNDDPQLRFQYTHGGTNYTNVLTTENSNYLYVSELGAMWPVHPSYAVGGAHMLAMSSSGEVHGGLMLRLRRWFSPHRSLDVAVGATLYGRSQVQKPAFAWHLHYNLSNWFALTLMMETVKIKSTAARYYFPFDYRILSGQKIRPVFHIGMQAGRMPGLALHAVAGLVLGALILTFFTSDGWGD